MLTNLRMTVPALLCAGMLMAFAATAPAEVIVQDSFTTQPNRVWIVGTNGNVPPYANNVAPADVNLPGGLWTKVAGWNWGDPYVPASWDGGTHDVLNMGENGTAVAISLASNGGYVKPTMLQISAKVMTTNASATNGGVGLGFFSVLNPVNTGEAFTRNNFTGLYLAEDGSLTLYADGAAGVSIAGPALTKGTYYALSYIVNTTTGAISNVSLEGSTSVYTWAATPFSDAATTYATYLVSGGANARGGMDDFIVADVIPEPASITLLIIGGAALLRRR